MTYLDMAMAEKAKVVNAIIEDTCPGWVVSGAPTRDNDNGCLVRRMVAEPCVACWNQQVPGTEGIATGAALPRNDRFPELPPQLKSSSVDALIKLLAGQIEHWEAMRNSYAYEATVAQARNPGDCHDQCEHWSRNDEKISMLVGKLKACAAMVEQYKALSVELEKYREVCGYARCD